MTIKKIFLAISLLFVSNTIYGSDFFIARKINIEGLHKFDKQKTILITKIVIGQKISNNDIKIAIRSLYDTNRFDDIKVFRNHGSLIFKVKERPTIKNITFVGNKSIKDTDLYQNFAKLGINSGALLNKSMLLFAEDNLKAFYKSIGKFNFLLTEKIINLPNNSVEIKINLNEGNTVTLQQINLIGNKNFTSKKLLSYFDLYDTSLLSLIRSNRNVFQANKFQNSIKEVRDFYLNNGYPYFTFNSIQTNLTQDKKQLYISINISEGEKYNISDVIIDNISIQTIPEIEKIVNKTIGKQYNNSKIQEIKAYIINHLNNLGYPYASVKYSLEKNDDNTVIVNINVMPGNKYYVHKVFFQGNKFINDETLLSRMTEESGKSFSSKKLIENRNLLLSTGYFDDVSISIRPVGKAEVDVLFKVKERSRNAFRFGLGYNNGGLNGTLFGAYDNPLDNNKQISFNIIKGFNQNSLNISYSDPYMMLKDITTTQTISINNYKNDSENLSSYSNNSQNVEFALNYSSDVNTVLTLSLGLEHNDISNLKPQVARWRYLKSIDYNIDNIKGDQEYDSVNAVFNIRGTRNLLDNQKLPNIGDRLDIDMQLGFGKYDSFFRMFCNYELYMPISNDGKWILYTRAKIGYGDGLFFKELPFNKNFFIDKIGNLRGFSRNTVGPKAVYIKDEKSGTCANTKDKYCKSDDQIGGNFISLLGAELIVPAVSFLTDNQYINSTIRTSIFVDVANLLDCSWNSSNETFNKMNIPQYDDPDNFRASAGISLQWMSPFGSVMVSYAKPLKKIDGDILNGLQFSFGLVR